LCIYPNSTCSCAFAQSAPKVHPNLCSLVKNSQQKYSGFMWLR
jgi:hypothetical protein